MLYIAFLNADSRLLKLSTLGFQQADRLATGAREVIANVYRSTIR